MGSTDEILSHALDYAAKGWRVVNLRDGKIPRFDEWQKKATTDEDTIISWWEQFPDSNLGIALGPESNLIDIECDDEHAEEVLTNLFGEELPVCPTFAGRRGKHRLFKWRDDLPHSDKNNFKIGALEFRTGCGDKGAQSVFPPSIHPVTGEPYRWLVSPEECDPPDIPDSIVTKLWNWTEHDTLAKAAAKSGKGKEHWDAIFSGTTEGGRHESMASVVGKLVRGTADLLHRDHMAVLYQSVLAINQGNKPPLDEPEIKALFRDIVKREQQQRAASEIAVISPHEAGAPPDTQRPSGSSEGDAGAWRLVIVDSKPKSYEIYAPQFANAKNGCIVLTSEQMNSPNKIRTISIEEANYALPANFNKTWHKQGGVLHQLMASAEHRAAPLEENRPLVVAQHFLERIEAARVVDGDLCTGPDRSGCPTRLPDGSVVFSFNRVWYDMDYLSDKITRIEFSRLLTELGAMWYRVPTSGNNATRLKRILPVGILKLRSMIESYQINNAEQDEADLENLILRQGSAGEELRSLDDAAQDSSDTPTENPTEEWLLGDESQEDYR